MNDALQKLLSSVDLPQTENVAINGTEGIVSSRFKVSAAAATALVACGVAANTLWTGAGGKPQHISVDLEGAGLSLLGFAFQKLADNSQPERDPNRALVGFYPTRDGRWVHLHGAFPKLAQGTMDVLGCSNDKNSVSQAVAKWTGQELEDALAAAGLCGAMARSREEWLGHPQGQALAGQYPVTIEKIASSDPEPLLLGPRPLSGVKALDLTRVLAGPTCGRTLASHGAKVLKINSPHLPSVPPFVMDTGHGKRSAWLDLENSEDHQTLKHLVSHADVFSQGYRKGALEKRGFGAEQLAEIRPGIIYVSINAYGHVGPWANRPGWEQLAQTASGIALDEGSTMEPRLISAAATDYTTGYLAAFGVMAALARRATEGGSYHVKVSLAQTANWLYDLGLLAEPSAAKSTAGTLPQFMIQSKTGFGPLSHLGPILQMSETPPHWQQATVPLGSHAASWW